MLSRGAVRLAGSAVNPKGAAGGAKRVARFGSPMGWVGFGVAAAGTLASVGYYNYEKAKKLHEVRVGPSIGEMAIGGPFNLVDSTGKPTTDKDFLGKYMLLYFGFTHCPDICPSELTKMGAVVTALDGRSETRDKLQPVFISIDPHRDGVPQIAAYAKDWHPKFRFLTGNEEEVARAAKSYRVYYSKADDDNTGDYLVDHSIITYLVDPSGKCVGYFGQNQTAEQVTTKIATVLTDQAIVSMSFLDWVKFKLGL